MFGVEALLIRAQTVKSPQVHADFLGLPLQLRILQKWEGIFRNMERFRIIHSS